MTALRISLQFIAKGNSASNPATIHDYHPLLLGAYFLTFCVSKKNDEAF